MINVDLYPTFCAMTGATLPDDQPVDGQSLMPYYSDSKPLSIGHCIGTFRLTYKATIASMASVIHCFAAVLAASSVRGLETARIL